MSAKYFITPLLALICSTLFSLPILAQGWIASYPQLINGGFDYYSTPVIEKTRDGGQFLFGTFSSDFGPAIHNVYMIKTDQQGQQQWSTEMFPLTQLEKVIQSYDFTVVDDGYLASVGRLESINTDTSISHIEVVKYAANGQLDWIKTIETQNLYNVQYPNVSNINIHTLSDGNHLITSIIRPSYCVTCSNDFIMIKIDDDGNVIWRKTHSVDYFSPYGQIFYQTTVDNFDNPVVAIVDSTNVLKIHTFDNNGNFQNSQNIISNVFHINRFSELKFTSDNLLIIGFTKSGEDVSWQSAIYKIDLANNQILWEYNDQIDSNSTLYDFCIFPDDEIAAIYHALSDAGTNIGYEYRKITLISSDGILNEENILSDYNASYINSGNINYMVTSEHIECCDDGSMLVSGLQRFPNSSGFSGFGYQALMKIDSDHRIFTSKVSGTLYIDENQNCILDNNEQGIADQVVHLPNSFYYTLTDSLGQYCFILNEGTYETTSSLTNYAYWETACPDPSFSFTIANGDTILNNDLAYYSDIECPLMTVSIGNSFLRRCFTNRFYIEYCNLGTIAADSAFVEVNFGEYISVDSATIAYQQIDSDTYIFDIPESVEINNCGTFTIYTTVDCEAPLESTACTEANIFPNEYCGNVEELWDMSDIEVFSECVGDSIEFTISNKGQSMINTRSFVIYEDNLLRESGDFKLDALMDTIIRIADGPYTFRMTAEQSPFYPEDSNPQTLIEGCNGVNTTGIILTVPQDDRVLYTDIDCKQIMGSYDPNDKLVSPGGVGEEHFTTPEDEFEYTIRFQNVGNDTAFNVYILDTISQHLDVSTFVSGAASHPYEVQIIEGNIIRWDFPNILLVDSLTNEPDSHGFVKFNISQKPNNPDGTVIENIAGIYFDFNEPIITPLVFNTIKRPPFYDDFCEDFNVVLESSCDANNEFFNIILTYSGGFPGSNGYNITENITGATMFNVVQNPTILGPFAAGSAISYSVSVADHPQCSKDFSISMLDCITTDIELLNFSGKTKEQTNEITWSIATEKNVSQYELLRSTDGLHFDPIYKVAAKGNTNTITTYLFEDASFSKSNNYYQLKQLDYSGKGHLSKTIILNNSIGNTEVNLFPNPASDFISLELNNSQKDIQQIQILNKEGKEVYTEKYNSQEGVNNLSINIDKLSSGIYFIKIINRIENQIIKFVKN